MVDVLDSATLQRLQTLEPPRDVSTKLRVLIFSPDSRILTCASGDCKGFRDHELFVVSWDLQTGGVTSVINWQVLLQDFMNPPSIAYSANGKMVGALYYHHHSAFFIFVCDVASGVLVHSHFHKATNLLLTHIWTHGESLRFATVDGPIITVWEVGFTSSAAPTEVETLRAPDGFGAGWHVSGLLPIPFRLVLSPSVKHHVVVWDARNSRYLLECTDAKHPAAVSFSSDGHFFACSADGSDVHLWKESPTGYTLHGMFKSNTKYSRPLLDRSGESIIVFGDPGYEIGLWRTKNITTPSSILTQAFQHTEDFILEFSPDGMLAAVAMRGDNIVTVLELKSGVPRLTIDTGMGVFGLGVIGDTVAVIDSQKVITWGIPSGDCVPGARVRPEDSSRTMSLGDPHDYYITDASISSNSCHIVLFGTFLHAYSASTGERLASELTRKAIPRFSPDGRDVWCAGRSGEAEVWRVGGGRGVLERLELTIDIEHPPEGYPWGSSRGYQVTNDWWILGPDAKRLLMLSPPWRSDVVQRVWKERFLALLHRGRSEPVIFELEVNHDL